MRILVELGPAKGLWVHYAHIKGQAAYVTSIRAAYQKQGETNGYWHEGERVTKVDRDVLEKVNDAGVSTAAWEAAEGVRAQVNVDAAFTTFTAHVTYRRSGRLAWADRPKECGGTFYDQESARLDAELWAQRASRGRGIARDWRTS